MEKAALYTRSSKDRSDVSLDAQRDRLNQDARRLELLIAEEFSDVVMSGQDATRPGFVALKARIVDPAREWTVLMMLDTARLSRDHDGFEQAWVHRECRRRGIRIHYAMMPATGTPADLIMLNTLRGVDGYHSLTSKIKGLAGMRENVKRGFRAGGRAPWGYQLEHVGTGVIRDGAEVRKSRLVPDSVEAPIVAAYLKARAAGISRKLLNLRMGLAKSDSTLVCVEWNALTYAGNTVWNVHAEPGTGHKRRPQSDWVQQPGTHAALITENEARAILERLAGQNRTRRRRTPADYLLTGILITPDGQPFHGDSGVYYRAGKGRKVRTAPVDSGILAQVGRELRSDQFVARLARAARKAAGSDDTSRRAEQLGRRDRELNATISRMMDLAAQMTEPGPALRKIEELETERQAIAVDLAAASRDAAAAQVYSLITEADVRAMLDAMVSDMQQLDRESLKDWLTRLLDKIELDPVSLSVRMHYRITPATGVKLASPREYELIPPLRVATSGKIAA